VKLAQPRIDPGGALSVPEHPAAPHKQQEFEVLLTVGEAGEEYGTAAFTPRPASLFLPMLEHRSAL